MCNLQEQTTNNHNKERTNLFTTNQHQQNAQPTTTNNHNKEKINCLLQTNSNGAHDLQL
jgi:hypothetical protein